VKKFFELGATLAVTSNRSTLRRYIYYLLVTADVAPGSLIFPTMMMEVIVPPKPLFLQEPHGVISQKMAFFNSIIVAYAEWRVQRCAASLTK
jgi:hypothetical protein